MPTEIKKDRKKEKINADLNLATKKKGSKAKAGTTGQSSQGSKKQAAAGDKNKKKAGKKLAENSLETNDPLL